MSRAANQGYWKATGKDREVRHNEQLIGMKKILVFHNGRAPEGLRTNWIMHEYQLVEEELERTGALQEYVGDGVVCGNNLVDGKEVAAAKNAVVASNGAQRISLEHICLIFIATASFFIELMNCIEIHDADEYASADDEVPRKSPNERTDDCTSLPPCKD
ncbi:hypothetical protein V6N13_034218 [Hibiscus sabdariffa]